MRNPLTSSPLTRVRLRCGQKFWGTSNAKMAILHFLISYHTLLTPSWLRKYLCGRWGLRLVYLPACELIGNIVVLIGREVSTRIGCHQKINWEPRYHLLPDISVVLLVIEKSHTLLKTDIWKIVSTVLVRNYFNRFFAQWRPTTWM